MCNTNRAVMIILYRKQGVAYGQSDFSNLSKVGAED